MTARRDELAVPDPAGRLFDLTFARLAVSAFTFFAAMGATFPVVPRYVRDELGHGDAAVGVVLGSMAVGAILGRPAIGKLGDERGRRLLLMLGGGISALAMLGHLVFTSLGALIALRVLLGVGQGAVMVGATTLAVDLAPSERSGEATSYIFVALHLGSAGGSLAGEALWSARSFNAVWWAAACAMSAAGLMALALPAHKPDPANAADRLGFFHPKALIPGLILGIGAAGFIGFNAFVPLFADEIGIDRVAPYFAAASLTIVAIRGFGARLPDRLGPRRGGSVALALSAVGLTAIGFSQGALWLGVGTIVLSCGAALLLPSLVTAAVDGVPLAQRSRALATYTLFLELSSAFGAVMFGAVAALSSYGAAFVASAGLALVALTIVQVAFKPSL